jgi:hypothetical protein
MVKISAREKLWKRRKAEKSKTDFPALLEIPQTPRGIPTLPTASAAAVCMTNTRRTKGDISIVVK